MDQVQDIPKVADLCDAYRSTVKVLSPIFYDFGGKASFSGPAVTVKCFEDNTAVKALSLTEGHGRVLVVDGGGSPRCALLGDNLAMNLLNNGWLGAVIYGYIRDRAELAALPIGIKALGANPLRSAKEAPGVVGNPVEFAGQIIQNGDVIYADEDGIIILNHR
ncbi:Putative regulator of ribonuclease activity [Leminorella richardii]|uniref:4-hydroxy-4-methyl-2-oxoglutarate aldolase n=1 Tax=Leminorella richardii TaxID=158841 RepID=A0A2X4UPY6_9GAMM|nr:ribonuclease E activity regulator RraA [Leminorella richardii]SQI41897.1 Putative regulator of ribonuclease activity [Leminorella richardii]